MKIQYSIASSVFILVLFVFLSGCLGQPTCNKPYILVGTDCCLDSNNNSICDNDETQIGQHNQTEEQNLSQQQVQNQTAQQNISAQQNQSVQQNQTTQNQTAQNQTTENQTQETGNTTLETTSVCGDGSCDASESSSCCSDCGCAAGQTCVNNSCSAFQGFKQIPQIDFKLIQFCGDGVCNNNENSSTCCDDCGCSGKFTCYNNTCLSKIPFTQMYTLNLSSYDVKLSSDSVAEGTRPKISEFYVAWHDYISAKPHIMLYNLKTSKVVQLSNATSEYGPDIFAKRLVWEDGRRPTGAENIDIYYYDIPNGVEGILTTRIGYKHSPKIDGDTIVWSEQASSGENLYMFNLVSKQETKLLSGANIIGYDVWGNNIAWSMFTCNTNPCTYNIYVYNTVTKKSQKILDTQSPLDYSLRIYGNKTVYIVGSGTNTQVNVYDLNTKLTTQITSGAGQKVDAVLYNNTVVWADKRNGNWDIYSYDLVQKAEKALVTETHDQKYPDIYGNKIVYLDARNNRNIYMYVKMD